MNRLLFLTVCECVWLIQCIQGRGLPGSPPVLFPMPAIVRWMSGGFPIRELLTGNHRLRIELRDPNVLYEVLFMISLRAGPQFPNMSCHITLSFFRSCSSMAEDNEDLPGIPKKPLTAQLYANVAGVPVHYLNDGVSMLIEAQLCIFYRHFFMKTDLMQKGHKHTG